MSRNDFDEMLDNAVSEALSQLGETVKQTILYYLERNFNMKPEEVPRRPTEFANALSALLGSGADPLENIIIQTLYTKIDVRITVQLPSQDTDFIDFIRRAREFHQSARGPSAPTDSTIRNEPSP
jgi:hypothetical protein